ncbi:SurA N-terminal domain-containing protein, partial [Helicobacter ganmani]
MIGWMQKHKKYLIITIWISTIAFVGAGFVGWGSYSFSSTSNAVAVVG